MPQQYKFIHVCVKFQFAGIHFWKDASGKQSYLKYPHRHVFHVTATKRVDHLDRDIEFIQLKEQMEAFCKKVYTDKEEPFEDSCEMIAHELCDVFKLDQCCVLEDNENGASITVVLQENSDEAKTDKPRTGRR